MEKEVVEIYLYQSKNQQISLYFTLDMYVLKLNIQDTRATSVEADLVFLTHFSPVLHFYIPWKSQKTKGFLMFSGGIDMDHWAKMD